MRAHGDGVRGDVAEARLVVHGREMAQWIRIAGRGGGEHGHGEGGGHGRRDAILVGHKLQRGGAAAGRRAGIEKCGAGGGVPVMPVLFGEDAVDGEEIAEDADAALRGRAVAGDGRDVAGAFAHGAEDVEIDCGFEGRGALVGLQHLEDQGWSRGSQGRMAVVHG